MERILTFIDRTLSTRVTPLAYLLAALGIVRGLAFTFFQFENGVSNTVLFKNGVLIPLTLWGVFVLTSSIVLMFGLLMKMKRPVMWSSMTMFMLWVLTCITYVFTENYFYLLGTAILYMLSYGYFFLAASLDRLWDYTPYREGEL